MALATQHRDALFSGNTKLFTCGFFQEQEHGTCSPNTDRNLGHKKSAAAVITRTAVSQEIRRFTQGTLSSVLFIVKLFEVSIKLLLSLLHTILDLWIAWWLNCSLITKRHGLDSPHVHSMCPVL